MFVEPYKKLLVWQKANELRRIIFQLTQPLESTHRRLAGQMQAAARSVPQNIAEAYKKGQLGTLIQATKVSGGSLEELIEDLEDCQEDGLIDPQKCADALQKGRNTKYFIDRYLMGLIRKQHSGTWKSRWDK